MPDNVFEKLDRIEGKVDALSPSDNSEQKTVAELIAQNDPCITEFVKTADRVFRYNGDKSELNRKNKKNKRNQILCAVISFLSMTTAAVFSFLIFGNIIGIVSVVIGVLLCSPYVIFAITDKPREYEIPYEKFFSKLKTYDYDDNGIVCDTKDKWYITLHRILPIVYLYVVSFALAFGGMDKFGLYFLLFFGFLLFAIALQILSLNKEYYFYTLLFEDEKNSIEYYLLKDFMTKNGLK